MLSVIIITKNEAHNIAACLDSVAWVDEIIVVDSGSTDNTISICQSKNAQVLQTDWHGFGPQKNRALALAHGDWILSIDADERVSDQLRVEIQAAIKQSGHCVAYKIPRSSYYCGQFMRHSGWWPDHVTRLFQRESAKFTEDAIHEKLLVKESNLGTLKHPLIHYSFMNAEDVLGKINSYSSIRANRDHANEKSASIGQALFHGLWAFFKTYIIKFGFLDGKKGLMLAISNAEGSYYRYIKLMLLSEKKS
jgi:glycosyltransferase involved in cell wall biosynthesis